MREREELKLVERFEELKAGMLVVNDCLRCGGRHRGILVRYAGDGQREPAEFADGTVSDCRGWERIPASHGYRRTWITPRAVEERRIWKVETGLDDQQAQREGENLGVAAEVHRRMLARQRP